MIEDSMPGLPGKGFTRRGLVTAAALAVPFLVLSDGFGASAAEVVEVRDYRWDPEFNEGQAQLALPSVGGPQLSRDFVTFTNTSLHTKFFYYVDYESERRLIQLNLASATGARPSTFIATIAIPGYSPLQLTFLP